MVQRLIFISLSILLFGNGYAQDEKRTGEYVKMTIEDGDTIPEIYLGDIVIEDGNFELRYKRIKHKVIKVYPYAMHAKKLLAEYESDLTDLEKKRQQKKYVKHAKKDLMDDFTETIKNMTTSQGIILIKLINRETGYTVYDIIKDYQSGTKAGMWNVLGKLWDVDLKQKYDPNGEDWIIEDVVTQIEQGKLKVIKNPHIVTKQERKVAKRKRKKRKKEAKS